jgi:hypothetical protein
VALQLVGPLSFFWGTSRGRRYGVFLLFGCLTLVALLYFWREVPETKGRSLQEIERDLVGRAVSPGGR